MWPHYRHCVCFCLTLLLAYVPAHAQYRIDTFAGGGTAQPADGLYARDVNLLSNSTVGLDNFGNVVVSNVFSLFRVDVTTRAITLLAKSSVAAQCDSNQVDRGCFSVFAFTSDASGNMFLADALNCRVRRIDYRTQIISTIAGTGAKSSSGDDGPAIKATLQPIAVQIDKSGNLLVLDYPSGTVRRIDLKTGIITRYAGQPGATAIGDGGPATAAHLGGPSGIAVDKAGNLFIADFLDYRIRRVDANSGIITTVAGTGEKGVDPDNVPATNFRLSGPMGVAVSGDGTLYISDTVAIHRVDAKSGILTTIAGQGSQGESGDGGPAVRAQVGPTETMAIEPDGTVYFPNYAAAGGKIEIRVRVLTPMAIINTSLPPAVAGRQYLVNLNVRGGVPPYQFTVSSGALTRGLQLVDLGPTIGWAIAGTPQLSPPSAFTLSVTDSTGTTTQQAFTLNVAASAPYFSASGVVNAASYASSGVAPGEIVAVYGSGLGGPALAGLQVDSQNFVTRVAGETRVLFDGLPAPMIYAREDVVGAVVPYSVANRPATTITVEYKGVSSTPVSVPVVPSAPGIFALDSSGVGPGAILNQDGTVNLPANGAQRRSIIQFFATGEGLVTPTGIDGAVLGLVPPVPVAPVSVTIGGVPAGVLYAGGASGFVAGALVVAVRVPDAAPLGTAVPLRLTVGAATSQPGITISVRE